MVTKIEFFEDRKLYDVQKLVNKFLEENPVEYVDAQYIQVEGQTIPRVMLVYRETISAEQERGVEKLNE